MKQVLLDDVDCPPGILSRPSNAQLGSARLHPTLRAFAYDLVSSQHVGASEGVRQAISRAE